MNLRQLQENFDDLAAEDPLWTVLSDNAKRGGKWDETEFYRTGEAVIDDLQARLHDLDIPLQGDQAIDFGCGVGRLTFPLGRHFQRCVGIDISQNMIDFADARRSTRGPNCRFAVNTSPQLQDFEDASFDFAYSAIVFQHISPAYTLSYLQEFGRVLRSGGLLVFQLPSHLNPQHPDNQKPFRLLRKRFHYRWKAIAQRLANTLPFLRQDSFFEMNAIPKDKVVRYLEKNCQCELLDAQDFPAAGPAWVSYLYIARKT